MSRVAPLFVGLWLIVCGGVCSADDAPATLYRHLPPGSIAAVEVTGLAEWIDKVEASEDYRDWLVSPLYQAWSATDRAKGFLQVNQVLQMQFSTDAGGLLKQLLGHRAALAIYPPTNEQPDAVLLIEAKDAAAFERIKEIGKTLLGLAGEHLTSSTRPDGYWQLKHIDGNTLVFAEQCVVLSNNASLLELTVSRLREPAGDSLADDENLQEISRRQGTKHVLHGWVNLAWVKEQRIHRWAPEKLPDPLGSLLLGGFVELAEQSPAAGVTVDVSNAGVKLTLALAGQVRKLPGAYQASFPADNATDMSLPKLNGMLGGVTLYRQLSQWYAQKEAVLDSNAQAKLAGFTTTFRALMQGKDFADDVLPTLGSRWTLVAAPQSFAHLSGKPATELPAFALVVDLADPDKGGEVLRLQVQTAVSLSNLQAGQQNRQPWIMKDVDYRNTSIIEATYDKPLTGKELPPAYNFTPAAARVKNRFVIATSPDLCRSLIDTFLDEQSASRAAPPARQNFLLEVSPAVVAKLLSTNRAPLIDKAVRDGKTKGQAERELAWLLQLMERMPPVKMQMTFDDDTVRLEADCVAQ